MIALTIYISYRYVNRAGNQLQVEQELAVNSPALDN